MRDTAEDGYAGIAPVGCFEANDLHRIVDLMRHLRGPETRRHVRVEIPFYTGRRKPLEEIVRVLP